MFRTSSGTARRAIVLPALAALALGTAACGGSSSGSSAAAPAASSSAAAPSQTSAPAASPSDAVAGPVGPGCAAYAAQVPSGAGSVAGMAADPVATAASNNPLLTTLVAAVSGKLNPKVNLVDTLNGGEFTVFAPVDAAFAKVPAATIATLKTDDALLSKILTYHVVPGQLSPEDIAGMQKTVEGSSVDVTGTPDALEVDGAKVICGGVKTANATVYLIDGVLTPKS
jgi:uncharacterized surface protein with fasciclin (FAS1) repeats